MSFAAPDHHHLEHRLEAIAGIQLHVGKTRDGVVNLGPEVWSPSGAKILGILVGSLEFVSNLIEERLDEERKLWQAISFVPGWTISWEDSRTTVDSRCGQ